MRVKMFDKEVDVAVIGLTNSGKSTFITSMIDREKFGDTALLKKLCDNDGGLTKVTTFYSLTGCDCACVDKVEFHDDLVDEKNKITADVLRKLKIEIKTSSEAEDKDALRNALEQFRCLLEGDLAYTIRTINTKDADKIIRYVRIRVPATAQTLELMNKHGFETVVLRDTRGFLDESAADKKSPNLADNGLDEIQACILMNGQNSVMPNLARNMYGDFVKSVFEAVPTFIIERSATLADKLENETDDMATDYENLINDPNILKRQFKEIRKFLVHLGIVNENGEATNQLIEANKRQLLLPEVGELRDEEYKLYSDCAMEVFDRLLNSLTEFRALLKRIIFFFDDASKVTKFQTTFLDVFEQILFSDIVTDFSNGDRYKSVYVRPIPDNFDMRNLLDGLIKKDLLGPRGGITTKYSGFYEYGHTGIFAVAAWKALNEIILNFNLEDEYTELAKVIVHSLDMSERNNKNIVNTYILEVKQCLKYVLQNSCTDRCATFSGYYFVERNIVVNAIEKVKNEWLGYETRFGANAMDTVFLTGIKKIMVRENLNGKVNLTRASQLSVAFRNVIEAFFASVSNNHNYLGIKNEVTV